MNLLSSKWFWGPFIVIMALMYLLREYSDIAEQKQKMSGGPWPPPAITDYVRPIPPLTIPSLQKEGKERIKPVPIPVYKGRILIGTDLDTFRKMATAPIMLNRYNKEWVELLTQQLHRFQPNETRIKVSPQKSYIQIEQQQGRYLEEVYIETLFPNGTQNSFKALVDSQNGHIVDSWDWSRSEKISNLKMK